MKSALVSLIIFVGFSGRFVAQPNAVDWTVNDCNSVSHHLFAELDSGKVIVLVWVMPCGLCIGPALTAYNVTQGFISSGCPVRYYLADDYANTTCSTLGSWAATNGIGPNITTFVNAAINMQDYGFPGMPKVVVLARNDHYVYYVEDNAITAGPLQNAISQACNDVLNGLSGDKEFSAINISPNPASGTLIIRHPAPGIRDREVIIFDLYGNKVMTAVLKKGSVSSVIDISGLPEGIYIVNPGNFDSPVKLCVTRE